VTPHAVQFLAPVGPLPNLPLEDMRARNLVRRDAGRRPARDEVPTSPSTTRRCRRTGHGAHPRHADAPDRHVDWGLTIGQFATEPPLVTPDSATATRPPRRAADSYARSGVD
jgi:hypothetical protein